MANWKLKELRDERRRTFLKMCGVAAAAVGVERTQMLNFLADEGGHGLAEAAGATYGRSLIVPCPNGVYAWMQELWPHADMALRSVNNSSPQNDSSYLYSPYNNFSGMYSGSFTGMNVMNAPVNANVKYVQKDNNRPFFYSPDAPWFDHANGVPIFPVTGIMAGKDETHTEFPVSATALSGSSTMQAALASLGASSSNAIVPVLGIDPVKYGRAPGAPEVATVPSAAGMIDLFNSAASQFALTSTVDQELFETYYKALVGLRKSSSRSSWAPQMQVTKNAARIIGLNFASQLTPTTQDLADFGITEMLDPSVSMAGTQKSGIEQFNRCLIVVAKAFALGLSKTAIIALSPGPTSETNFTDPHSTFNSTTTKMQGRNTTKYLGKGLQAFYTFLSKNQDPESTSETLDKNTVFVTYGDTPHTPLTGAQSSWADATPNNSNWLYVMDPKQNIKQGWFGQVYPNTVAGKNAVGFNPITGNDDANKGSDQTASYACTAAVFAVAHGDKNKTAEFGNSPNNIPALINTK